MDVQPTLTQRAGLRFSVLVNQDIILTPYEDAVSLYKLELRIRSQNICTAISPNSIYSQVISTILRNIRGLSTNPNCCTSTRITREQHCQHWPWQLNCGYNDNRRSHTSSDSDTCQVV